MTKPMRDGLLRRLRSPDTVFQLTLLAIFVVVFLLLAATSDRFVTSANLWNIVRQAAPTLIVAVGMTFVITVGGIDLSVGSMLAVIAVLSALSLSVGWPIWLMVLAMLALGVALGWFNGYFTAYQSIPAFIVTLATLSILRGTAQLITKGYSIPVAPDSPFLWLGRGRVLDVPVPAILAIIVVIVGYVLLNHTRFGLYVTGIGSNEEGVRRAGVNVRRIKLFVFMFSGLAVALGGMVTSARLASGSSYSGVAFELQVIAAVIVGGTNLFGGEGRMLGTVMGTLLLAMIGNGLILAQTDAFYQQIIEGAIILAAIWFNLVLARQRRSPR
ncbi:MAG: ABC transporter permease [Trueperaceae bacterium]|nr:ABC transporter permease [Trueperaceae bacterium]